VCAGTDCQAVAVFCLVSIQQRFPSMASLPVRYRRKKRDFMIFKLVLMSGFLTCLLAAGSLSAQQTAPASTPSTLSLDQAVAQVQRKVGGKVLSAEPRQVGRKVEYRVKVLTPEGHVRVIAVPSDVPRPAPAAQLIKKSTPNGGSSKEKH